MKAWAIAWKDLRSSLRSAFLIVMMFVAPLLLTGILYFAFGGNDSGETTIATVRAVAVNLDRPEFGYGEYVVGSELLSMLASPDLSQVLELGIADDEAAARAEVDAGRADVAIIVPDGLTRAVLLPDATSQLTIYHDPALSLGPTLVKSILEGYADGYAGVKIAGQVWRHQSIEQGSAPDTRREGEAMQQYGEWVSGLSARAEESALGLEVRTPQRSGPAGGSLQAMLATTLIGMTIFFVFFTGASMAESIVTEDEQHTLARLFTTPTPRAHILSGKLLSVAMTVSLQMAVLLLIGRLVFDVHWGQLLSVALMSLGLVAAAAGCGVLLMSLIKTTRQSGVVMGGVLTLSGMLGGLMTLGIPNPPAGYRTLSLLTPHGWALRGWLQTLKGLGVGDVWTWALGCLVWGAITFAIGVVGFRKRFA